MKKALKIIGIVVGILLILLLLAPFLFKGTLEDLLKKNLNKNLNAQVEWEELDISLFRSFPDAAVVVNNFRIITNAPFEGDTLAQGQSLKLDMGITQLLKSSNDAIKIDALQLDEAFIHIKIDSLGRTNYDIAIKDETLLSQENSTENNGFVFDLQHYEINNSTLHYSDEKTKTFLSLTALNHEGNGDFSLDTSALETTTDALVSFRIDGIEYLSESSIALDATFQMDLKNQKYTFLENEAKVNELPLTFNGFVQVNENNSTLDLTFKTPSSDFKNFLAVIPKKYVKNLDGVTTTGNFSVNGILKGTVDDTYIPQIDIAVASDNASFKYPDLPKAVRNISIDARLKNETGLAKDTYLTIGGITFKIDDQIFKANGSIRNLTANVLVDMALKGTLNLANIEQVLPLELSQDLSGVFTADVRTQFDLNSVETEQYQNIKTDGTAGLTNFVYQDAAFSNAINVSEVAVSMSPGTINLEKLNATSGETDISATGTIQNLIPWMMAKQDLKGRFQVQSNTFNVNDFMAAESTSEKEPTTTSEAAEKTIQIPDFMDATLDFTANKVIYDNVKLKTTKGTVRIADETAKLSNVTSKVFGGDVGFSGTVNTQGTIPKFNMNLDLQKIDIDESFGTLSLLKYIAPIAKALDGNLNTQLNLTGTLNANGTPDLKSLAGSALAQIITAEVNPQQAPLLSKLGEQVKFLNIDKLSLQDVSTALDFNNGNIVVKPFTFSVKDIEITASGSHGLDKSINYNLAMDVPARYLGGDVNKLLSKLEPQEANAMTVALPIGLSGTMTSPKVSVNTAAAVKTLTQKLIDKQKQNLKDKGSDILKDILTGGGNANTPKDSTSTQTGTNTPTEQTTKVVKDILGGLFSKTKKKKDSTRK